MKAFGVFPLGTADNQWIVQVFEEGALDWRPVEPRVVYTNKAAAEAERDRLYYRETRTPLS